ncbi:hypothetical protein Tco_1404662 [Tanacetum coccineum]
MDVKTPHFLNGPLKERGLRCSAGRFIDPYHPEKVIPSKERLYGLRQAPRDQYAGCHDTRKALLSDTVPVIKLCKLDVKETKLHCNGLQQGRVMALSSSLMLK